MSFSKDNLSPTLVPLRNLDSPANSIQSSDFDHLLSEDEARSEVESNDGNYPPVDGGRKAWTFLLACWLIEAMIWGFPLAFGIFQSHYSAHPLFKDSKSIPTIGTLATGVSYLGMPLTNAIALRWPQHQRIMCGTGWLMCVLGLIGASLATKVWHLLLSQGLLYGTGWVVCYTPFLFMLNGWFVEKRGLAYGILFGASGVSGLIIPLAVGALLTRFGFRTALRAYAAATILLSGPGLFLIKPREAPTGKTAAAAAAAPRTTTAASNSASDLRTIAHDPHFVVFAAAIFLQGLAFFLPNIFIPSYSASLALGPSAGNGLLALTSLSQVAGQITLGHVSDKTNPYIPTSLASFVSGVGVLLLWGPAKGLGRLAPFALLWGFFSASYSVLYTSTCSFLAEDEGAAMLIYGIFSFERGVANILEGPISSFLLGGSVHVEMFGLGRYGRIVWFTGICMLLSSLGGAGLLLRRRRR
ncbi:hypothetical protein MBLNU459_g6615t1 [Dothideomycetes sp. NU459]